MQYAAMFAILALLGPASAGATVMAAGFGHGAPDDVQAQAHWMGPPGFGQGNCSGPDGPGFGGPGMADDDGDGIPNGQDPDWIPPGDGTGHQYRHKP